MAKKTAAVQAKVAVIGGGINGRVFFVLPYQGKTLVGTTEKRQRRGD